MTKIERGIEKPGRNGIREIKSHLSTHACKKNQSNQEQSKAERERERTWNSKMK